MSFPRLCQHSFPLPLPVATVNSFVLSCYGTPNISHPVPDGHTYLCRRKAAKARFDNRHSISAPAPILSLHQRQRRKRYKRSLNRQCYPLHFMRECIPPNLHDPQRAKGSLNRRFEWFSLVTFFLQKKKVTRAGARNSPSRARRQCPPNIPAASAATYPLRCFAPQWARFDNRHSTSAPDPILSLHQRQRRKQYKRSLNRQQCHPPHQFREASTAKFALALPAPRGP